MGIRLSLAFFLQPFVCGVLGFVLFPVLDSTHPGRTDGLLQGAIAFGVLTGLVGTLITGGAAYPAFEYLRKRRIPTATETVLLAAAFGNIPAAIVIVGSILRAEGPALPEVVSGAWRAIVFGSVIGRPAERFSGWSQDNTCVICMKALFPDPSTSP